MSTVSCLSKGILHARRHRRFAVIAAGSWPFAAAPSLDAGERGDRRGRQRGRHARWMSAGDVVTAPFGQQRFRRQETEESRNYPCACGFRRTPRRRPPFPCPGLSDLRRIRPQERIGLFFQPHGRRHGGRALARAAFTSSMRARKRRIARLQRQGEAAIILGIFMAAIDFGVASGRRHQFGQAGPHDRRDRLRTAARSPWQTACRR